MRKLVRIHNEIANPTSTYVLIKYLKINMSMFLIIVRTCNIPGAAGQGNREPSGPDLRARVLSLNI
jgi:hypothetical protein